MKLVVGLGNPGQRYARTRHNVGFRILERFAERARIPLGGERFAGRFGHGVWEGIEVALLEPLTYMNRSGSSVAAAVAELGLEDPERNLILAFDDVDLPLGQLRIRGGGGAGGHRGVADVIERLGRRDFARLRFGIGRPPPGLSTTDYVLEPFSPEEAPRVEERLDVAADALGVWLREGLERAMNRFNATLRDASTPDERQLR